MAMGPTGALACSEYGTWSCTDIPCGGRGHGVHRTLQAEGGQVDPHKPPGKLAVSTPAEHFPAHKPAAQEPASYESKDVHA